MIMESLNPRFATQQFGQHPLSAAFPAMLPDDYQRLKDSIEAIGVQNPIVLLDSKVLDGWHRYCAATELCIACPAVELGDQDPKDFVIAQNERRRHLTASQIADAVVRVFSWIAADIGRPRVIPGSTLKKTNAELAEIARVSIPTISQAKFVQSNAEPEVQDAVKSGAISLKSAAAVAKLTALEQKLVAAAGPLAMKKCAKSTTVAGADTASHSELEELREFCDGQGQIIKELLAENESMMRAFDADDRIAAAMAEVKRFNALNAVLESRNAGLMSELNEVKRLLRIAQRRAERAEAGGV